MYRVNTISFKMHVGLTVFTYLFVCMFVCFFLSFFLSFFSSCLHPHLVNFNRRLMCLIDSINLSFEKLWQLIHSTTSRELIVITFLKINYVVDLTLSIDFLYCKH